VIVANFPVSLLGGLVPPPLLGFMPLYFWAMVRPDLMTPFWASRSESCRTFSPADHPACGPRRFSPPIS